MKSVKKYPWIDTLYTIGIMLVILGHSHPSDWTLFSGTIFEKIILFIYTFHMPLFFFYFWISIYEFSVIKETWL